MIVTRNIQNTFTNIRIPHMPDFIPVDQKTVAESWASPDDTFPPVLEISSLSSPFSYCPCERQCSRTPHLPLGHRLHKEQWQTGFHHSQQTMTKIMLCTVTVSPQMTARLCPQFLPENVSEDAVNQNHTLTPCHPTKLPFQVQWNPLLSLGK